MQRLLVLRYIFVSLLLIFTAIMLYQHHPKLVLAEAPSFTLRRITDPISDWILIKGDLLKSSRGNSSTDISSVSYSSNGKTLNATLWLSSPFDNEPASPVINYGLIIDTNLNQTTGIQPADYRISIRWENKTQTWTKLFEQLGPFNQKTVYSRDDNFRCTI